MKINLVKQIFLLSFIFFSTLNAFSQDKVVIDRVVANVGDKIILQSDIENQVLQFIAQGYPAQSGVECQLLQQLLTQKLLLIQAEYDTLVVSSNVVESELQQRLDYFIRQIGSEKKLEEYYHKSILEIKDDFRPLIEEQLKTQTMQRSIVEGLDVSPKDVEAFYKKLPKDSIPLINTQYEIKQIAVYPEQSENARNEAREKLLGIRERIVNGERFSTLAVLYSEDPGSARRGGELGFRTRDELDPEFAKAAFRLSDEAGVSRIVESEYGFHIIQLIAREGNQVNVRHILVIPKIDIEQKVAARSKLDSISLLIKNDSISFEDAALKLSEDELSKLNKGLMVNQMNASTRFSLEELPAGEYGIIKNMKPGEISEPFESKDNKGKTVYKIVKIDKIIESHRANLDMDYMLIEEMALTQKRMDAIDRWINDKKKKTYIHIDESFKSCEFLRDGWVK